MISGPNGCAERRRAKGATEQERAGMTEDFICQLGDTSGFMDEYFSCCQSWIRNHHEVGEHEYCP